MPARIAPVALAAVVLAPATAHAHHSQEAIYDQSQRGFVQGVVSRVIWANPHVYFFVEQTTEDGETTLWEMETHNPGRMQRQGWTSETLKPGDRAGFGGFRTRDPNKPGLFVMRIMQDGEPLYSGGDISRANAAFFDDLLEASGLAGTWEVRGNLIAGLPSNSSDYVRDHLKLTEAGTEAFEAFDEATMMPLLDCIPTPPPQFMHRPDSKRITIEEDVIRIVSDGWGGGERIIHLDVDDHDDAEPSALGHSIGRWDGDTLVIDSTHFADHATGNASGVPSGASKHLVERLTLSEDGSSLIYEFESDDPEFLGAPLRGTVNWIYRPDFELGPTECDLESSRLFLEQIVENSAE